MQILSSSPTRLWAGRMKQVLSRKSPYMSGLGKYVKTSALVFEQKNELTIDVMDGSLPNQVANALCDQGITQVQVSYKKDDLTYDLHVQIALAATLRSLALNGNQEDTITTKFGNIAVQLKPGIAETVATATISSLDELTMKKAGESDKVFTAKRILKRLPMKNYLSPNFWRGLLANVVMADEKLINKYSEVTNKMVELETSSLSYFAKARTLAKFFRQTFEPKDRTFLLKLGALAATLSPAIFYFVFSQAVRQAAKLFIAGENATEANKVMNSLSQSNIGYVLDFVAEEATDNASAEQNINSYINALRNLQTKQEKVASVKLTGLVKHFSDRIAMGGEAAQIAKTEAIAALNKILEAAHANNAVVIVDLERFSVKDATLEILETTIRQSNYKYAGNLGVVEQTYLRSSLEDTARLAKFAKECHEATQGQSQLFIRFVKGAYQNSDKEFVLDSHEAVNERYIECLKIAYEQFDAIRFAIASHNLRTISQAIELANKMGLDANKLEFEMLLGMPATPLMYALAKMGRTCRFYMPVGSFFESLGYFMRRMVENANSSSCQTLFKQFAAKKLALEEYLAKVFEQATNIISHTASIAVQIQDILTPEEQRKILLAKKADLENELLDLDKEFAKQQRLFGGGSDYGEGWRFMVNIGKPYGIKSGKIRQKIEEIETKLAELNR